MTIEIRAYVNSDSATVVWRTDARIPNCLGFALHRRATDAQGKVTETVLENRIGFAGDPNAKPGSHASSEQWPIQRFIWNDYAAAGAGSVSYRAVARVGTPGKLADGPASGWSTPCSVGTGSTPGFSAYFNRGMIASQWVARALQAQQAGGPAAALKQDIADPANPLRQDLGGVLRTALLELLAKSNAAGETIYLALYELNDPELLAAMQAYGKRCNLLLGSGAFKSPSKDENADIRQKLKAAGKINIYDRIVGGKHFAHNKFVVFCDKQGKPQRAWTGSTNWTVTGLCTQVNNGILVDSPDLAAAYLRRWNTLKAAGDGYPPEVAQQGSTPAQAALGGATMTAWNVPVLNLVDLADARRLIQGARQGVLFLFFNPGPKGTLLNDILALQQDNLFIHGVVNQDPGGKTPILTLHDRGTPIDAAPEAVVPAPIADQMQSWFGDEYRGNMVMIHSKVVLIDPFGPHPVLMTGSHNLGPKASGFNDDNLLIVENAPGLAAEYAVNMLGVFDHYKFRASQHVAAPAKGAKAAAAYKGLAATDAWQDGYYQAARKREIDFWFGGLAPVTPGMRPSSTLQPEDADHPTVNSAVPAPAAPAATPAPAPARAAAKKAAAGKAAARKSAAGRGLAKKPAKKSPVARRAPRGRASGAQPGGRTTHAGTGKRRGAAKRRSG
ncbi:MAG TPA: phospholipase D-like domain-containing protein [Nevskia sp.]|nr:phospholipase D-like domain-containing protein [Nevskia sp.]